jgi:hypothetical protein
MFLFRLGGQQDRTGQNNGKQSCFPFEGVSERGHYQSPELPSPVVLGVVAPLGAGVPVPKLVWSTRD